MPWSRKYNTAIVGEKKAFRVKVENMEKLENTINAILECSPKLSGDLEKIVAIIHFNRGDLMIPRILRSRNRTEKSSRYILYLIANRNKELHMLLNEYRVMFLWLYIHYL